MTPEELDEIEKRANAATPGPWLHGFYDGFGKADHDKNLGAWIMRDNGDVVCEGGKCRGITLIPDADFIAGARADIPRLIAAAREFQRRLVQAASLAMQIRAHEKIRDQYWQGGVLHVRQDELRVVSESEESIGELTLQLIDLLAATDEPTGSQPPTAPTPTEEP